MTDYYDAVHMLCKAQQNFARNTQVLEEKIEDKSVFLDIMRQVQLPSVKVQVRTVKEMEKIEGKTYRELRLMCHLPNFKRINPNTKEQTRMMAACWGITWIHRSLSRPRPFHKADSQYH